MEFIDGTNTYGYVGHNPWTNFDPLGLWTWGGVGAVAGIAVGIGIACAFAPAVLGALAFHAGASIAAAMLVEAAAGIAIAAVGSVALANGVVSAEVAAVELYENTDISSGAPLDDSGRQERVDHLVYSAAELVGGLAGFKAGEAGVRRISGGSPKVSSAEDSRPNSSRESATPESSSYDASANTGNGIKGTNKKGEVTSRSKFRKDTLREAWEDAELGPNGGRSCPGCSKECMTPPNSGSPRDWDGSHSPSWTNRLFPEGVTRPNVLDNFNEGVFLECPSCNRSRGNNDSRLPPSTPKPTPSPQHSPHSPPTQVPSPPQPPVPIAPPPPPPGRTNIVIDVNAPVVTSGGSTGS